MTIPAQGNGQAGKGSHISLLRVRESETEFAITRWLEILAIEKRFDITGTGVQQAVRMIRGAKLGED